LLLAYTAMAIQLSESAFTEYTSVAVELFTLRDRLMNAVMR